MDIKFSGLISQCIAETEEDHKREHGQNRGHGVSPRDIPGLELRKDVEGPVWVRSRRVAGNHDRGAGIPQPE
jgi:hypothetical protein